MMYKEKSVLGHEVFKILFGGSRIRFFRQNDEVFFSCADLVSALDIRTNGRWARRYGATALRRIGKPSRLELAIAPPLVIDMDGVTEALSQGGYLYSKAKPLEAQTLLKYIEREIPNIKTALEISDAEPVGQNPPLTALGKYVADHIRKSKSGLFQLNPNRMIEALMVIDIFNENGGVLQLEGGNIRCSWPGDVPDPLKLLVERAGLELSALLKRMGSTDIRLLAIEDKLMALMTRCEND